MTDESKTLIELEQADWGEPDYDSYLVRACYALRRKPLADFTADDLRIMIGQNISLNFLMPKALKILKQDPLVECTYYPGDLLQAIIRANSEYWNVQACFAMKPLPL